MEKVLISVPSTSLAGQKNSQEHPHCVRNLAGFVWRLPGNADVVFLGCEGCFYLRKQSCVGPLLSPDNTIPTPKPHSCSLALPAAPFLAQRCHCTVPEPLLKQTHPQRQGLLPPSAPGQGNTSQTPASCWNMALGKPGEVFQITSGYTLRRLWLISNSFCFKM